MHTCGAVEIFSDAAAEDFDSAHAGSARQCRHVIRDAYANRHVHLSIAARLIALTLLLLAQGACHASDHLDTAAVIADPAADIGDLYARISPDGKRLDLVMTIVGKKFSDHVRYEFHVDSGKRAGRLPRWARYLAVELRGNGWQPTAVDAIRRSMPSTYSVYSVLCS